MPKTGYLSENTTEFTGDVMLHGSNFSVGGAAQLYSTLSVGGAARLGSTLSVDGASTFQAAATFNAAIASASAISGGALAGTTLNLGSTASVRGITTLHAQLDSASAISSGAIAATTASFNTIDFLSVSTGANASGMTTRELRLVFAASGLSLCYSSGKTTYNVNSAESAVQA